MKVNTQISYTQILGKTISNKLSSMEQGAFQNFCLDFLPFVDSIYKDLVLFGGTLEGKTRKGTPDLINTLTDGRQIAVQCSTEKTYWNIPKEKDKWKPCEDIDKCLTNLNNVREIVVCSNQDISTKAPNAESEILSYAKSRTNAKITILYSVKIHTLLLNNIENPAFVSLYKKYFPEIHELVNTLKEKESLKLSFEIYKEKPISLKMAKEIADKAVKNIIDIEKAKDYALKEISLLRSKFERVNLPSPGNVKRCIPKESLLFNPVGKICTLLGVPKIGKSSLVSYSSGNWFQNKMKVHWFDCPIEDAEQKVFIEDLLRSIWSCFVTPDKATELAANIIKMHSISLDGVKYNFETPSIYILDNAELLLENTVKSLCKILVNFKRYKFLSNIAVLFISNKKLTPSCAAISEEISAPAWTEKELEEFLSGELPEASYYKNRKYMEFLTAMSGGHPLVGLALARKFSSARQLIFSKFKGPSLTDEGLTAEVKNFLFEDILKGDNDSLNFVLRLSILTHRANDKVIHAIAKKVNPAIAKPFNVILDRLYGTVIEGDQQQGYGVSFIYREIAKKRLSIREQQEIYDAVSLALLTPKNNILNAIEVTEGIFYAVFALNFERAFYWTGMLLQAAINKGFSIMQVKSIIDRLQVIVWINAPENVDVLPLYYLMILSMAMAYAHIENYEKACMVLEKIKVPSKEIKDEKLENILSTINEAAKIYRMYLIAKADPLESVRLLSNINFTKIKKYLPAGITNITSFSDVLFSVLSIKQIPSDLLKKIITNTDLDDKKAVVSLMKIALNLGVKTDREEVNPEEVVSLFATKRNISELLQLLFNAQCMLQKENYKTAIDLISQVITLCQKQGLWSNPVENVLSQFQGDTYYKLDKSKAKDFYLRCIKCLGDETKDFDYAWANYRSGLLSKDPKEAEVYFGKSSKTFAFIGYDDLLARSEGERGITLVQLDRPLEFVRIAEWMCRRYFLRNRAKFAPSVTMAMAQLTRLICDLRGETAPEDGDKIYPKFERGVYARVLDVAKPQAGGVVAFYSLSRGYGILKNVDRKMKCLRTALLFSTDSKIEKNSIPMIIRDLLDEIIPSGEEKEIKELIIQCISLDSCDLYLGYSRDPKEFLSFCIFSKLDSVINDMDNGQRQKILDILEEIQKNLSNTEYMYSDWWLATVCWRKARIGQNHYKNKREKYHLWKQAYEWGVKSNNAEVIFYAGHTLGFFHCENYFIRDLADIQFNVLKSIYLNREGDERFKRLGQDLFKLWSKLDFWRLSEFDLNAKHALMDGAKAINGVGIPIDKTAPIMILLLSSVYEFKGESTDWAVDKLKEGDIEIIPEEIKSKINLYF